MSWRWSYIDYVGYSNLRKFPALKAPSILFLCYKWYYYLGSETAINSMRWYTGQNEKRLPPTAKSRCQLPKSSMEKLNFVLYCGIHSVDSCLQVSHRPILGRNATMRTENTLVW